MLSWLKKQYGGSPAHKLTESIPAFTFIPPNIKPPRKFLNPQEIEIAQKLFGYPIEKWKRSFSDDENRHRDFPEFSCWEIKSPSGFQIRLDHTWGGKDNRPHKYTMMVDQKFAEDVSEDGAQYIIETLSDLSFHYSRQIHQWRMNTDARYAVGMVDAAKKAREQKVIQDAQDALKNGPTSNKL